MPEPYDGATLARHASVEMLTLLDRCIRLERMAATLYETLARRFAADRELTGLWSALAGEEHAHARKLSTWRALVAAEPAERRPRASGFETDIAAVEEALDRAQAAAESADEEAAFGLALGLESSELDAIYITLVHASPLARHPDLADTARNETAAHHRLLLDAAERRCRTEANRLRIAMIARRDS